MSQHAPSIIAVCVATAVGLAACQTDGTGVKKVSIAEAKEISANFEDRAFTPPPRTITDVLAIIHENEATAAAQRQEWEALVKSEPPQDAGDRERARFYMRRAAARTNLGQMKEQIEDLEKAEAAASGRRYLLGDIYQLMGVSHTHGGNYRRGLEYRRRSLSYTDPNKWGKLIVKNATLADFEALIGDFSSAEKRLSEAKRWEATIPRWDKGREWAYFHRALVRESDAKTHLRQGQYRQAETFARRVVAISKEGIAADVDAPGIGYGLRHLLHWMQAVGHETLSQALLHQNRLTEAEVAARQSVELAVGYFGRKSIQTVEVLPALTAVLTEQGRAYDAERIARETVAIYRDMSVANEAVPFIRARVALAETLAAQGKWSEVLQIYRAIERDLSDQPEIFDYLIRDDAAWAMADIAAGDAARAAARLQPAYARWREDLGDKHMVTAETGGLLAAAMTTAGRAREALPIFERIRPIFASNSRDSAEQGVTRTARDRRISFILEANLAALHDASGNIASAADETLRVAGLAQGRSVQRAVLAAAARAAVGDPQLADLVRREQDARQQIAALYGTLANMMSVPPDRREASAEDQVRQEIDQLRSARAALASEIGARFPEYAALVDPDPPGVREVQAALKPGESLIATFVGQSASYVWAVPASGEARFARVEKGEDGVLADVLKLRRALDPNVTRLGDIPAFDVALAHEMYREFLAPVRAAWRSSNSLIVVSDGPLGQLPFGVMVTDAVDLPADEELLFDGYRDVPWLARKHAISVLPSVASLTALRLLPPGGGERRPFVGFGDPVFQASAGGQKPASSPSEDQQSSVGVRGVHVALRNIARMRGANSAELSMLPRLPDTGDEIRSIALAMNADLTRDVFVGASANEQQVKSMDLSGYRVIAFATHGLVPGDLNGLTQPALALSAPEAAGTTGDGLLTMDEVLSLRLNADWVVLSACNTGAAQGAGAEAISGLGRAFLYAGARALLVSNWPVETTSAKELTTDIFRRQAKQPGLGRAAALQQAMVALMNGPGYADGDTGQSVFSYAHPIFWAPFSVIGDGGGGTPGA